jgi:hypothetical protein
MALEAVLTSAAELELPLAAACEPVLLLELLPQALMSTAVATMGRKILREVRTAELLI